MTSRQTFSDRLRYCMDRMNYKQRYVAEQVGVSQPAVAKWLAGDTRKVQADILFRLADLFNVNPRWLSDGQGQPWVSSADDWIHEEEKPAAASPEKPEAAAPDPEGEKPAKRGPGRPRKENFTMELGLPGADFPETEPEKAKAAEKAPKKPKDECEDRCKYYASVPAFRLERGKSPLRPALVPDKNVIDAVIPKTHLQGHDPKACRLFIAQTDTMSPAICRGDGVIVDVTESQELHYGAVYLIYWDHQCTFARLMREPDGRVLLQFDNRAYASKNYEPGEFEKYFRVIGIAVLRFGSRFPQPNAF